MTRCSIGLVCALALAGSACLGGDDDDDTGARPDAGGSGTDGSADNRAPTANAGGDATAFTLSDVQLDGSASADPDGDALQFAWTQTGGDAVELVDADTATPRFAAPAGTGTLTFELTVSDGVATGADTVDVDVQTFAGELPGGGGQSPFSRGVDLLSQGRDVVAVGRYLYVADGSAGLRILDLADPVAPALAGTVNTPGQAMDVAVAGNHAYIADLTAGLQIIDVRDFVAEAADPAPPQLVGSAAVGGNANGVAVTGDYAFVANAAGIAAVDVSAFVADAVDPVAAVVSQVDTPGSAFEIVVDGDFAYVADRGNSIGGGLRIFDISAFVAGAPDPGDPINVGNHGGGGVYGVAVAGDYAFIAHNDTNSIDARGFVRAIDISDKTAPAEVPGTALDTATTPFDLVARGDLLYAIDSSNIEVIDISAFVAGSPGAGPLPSAVVYPVGGLARGFAVSGDYGYAVSSVGSPNLVVMNMADLANPQAVGRLSTELTTSDIDLAGDYAFVSFRNDVVLAVDATDPAAPFVPTNGAITNVAGGASIDIVGDHMFVGGNQPLEILDIGDFVAGTPDPPAPPIVATLDEWPQSVSEVVVAGGRAYMEIPLNGIQLVDVSDPTAPAVPVGGTGGMYTSSSVEAIAVVGDVLYLAGTDGLDIVDVSDPAAPVSLGGDDTIGFAGGITVRDGIAYIGANADGLLVYDVTDPSAPVEIGGVDVGSSVSRVLLEGDLLYVATVPIQKVAVVDVRDPTQPAVLAGYGPTSTPTGLAVKGDIVHMASFTGGYESFRFGSAAVVGAPSAVGPGAEVSMTLVWADGTNDLESACEAPAGSTCAVTSHDRDANTATVTWTVPTAPGDYALRAVVGDSIAFSNAYARVRVE